MEEVTTLVKDTHEDESSKSKTIEDSEDEPTKAKLVEVRKVEPIKSTSSFGFQEGGG